MGVVYPLSLGLDEGCAQATLRSWIVLVAYGPLDSEGAWLLPLFCTSWVIFSLATVTYMRLVFKRYETTRALPVEYGTVNVVNFASGMLYFNEGATMDAWQVALGLVGLALLVSGIFIGQLDDLLPQRKRQEAVTDVTAALKDSTTAVSHA